MKEQEQERPKPHILERGGGWRGFMGTKTKERDSTHWQGQWETPLEGGRVAAVGAKWRSSRTSFPLSPRTCWCRRPALPLRLRWLCSPLCHAAGVLVPGEGGAAPEAFCPSALCLELVLEK